MSPIPNQMMDSGTSATGEMGRISCSSGLANCPIMLIRPINVPIRTPTTHPTA
jgi:hypothetical protein